MVNKREIEMNNRRIKKAINDEDGETINKCLVERERWLEEIHSWSVEDRKLWVEEDRKIKNMFEKKLQETKEKLIKGSNKNEAIKKYNKYL